MDPLAVARRTLATESDALRLLADTLDDSFVAVVDRFVALAGRVVVTGMGKSGHIARKIAATLASTGTPSMFVHPGEAGHGDLGMITRQDAVLALSNSGETSELVSIVDYAKRFAIPLVAITGRGESSLAAAAEIALVLPDAPEACPMGLAPTTSTTMMLALGDALATALLEKRGFTEAEFHTFHPGGKLGRVLVRVRDLMHGPSELPLTMPDTKMSEAIVTMTRSGFGCVGVVDGSKRLIGIVTDGDLRRHMSPSLTTERVADVMTASPRTIGPDHLASEALGLMAPGDRRPITSLFVVEQSVPVGILHIHDLLRAGLM
ncbi:MAG: kpsF [Rhodospirillales bacterium]|nr:kpsF [Rhodospirillales bacterium]